MQNVGATKTFHSLNCLILCRKATILAVELLNPSEGTMKFRSIMMLSIASVLGVFVAAQPASDYTVPLTEYGQPDLQGVWNFATSIPMQRPTRFGNQEFLTPQEVEQEREKQIVAAAKADAAAAERVVDPDAPEASNDPGGYNDFWFACVMGDQPRYHVPYPQ